MARDRKMPATEWLPVVIPVAGAAILLSAAWGADHNWLVVLCCFAAGAAVPLTATLVMLRDHKLFLTDARAIEENKRRIAASRPLGWLLGACFLSAGVALGGVSKAVFLAVAAGLAFGFWPGLLANFLRLRREHYWG